MSVTAGCAKDYVHYCPRNQLKKIDRTSGAPPPTTRAVVFTCWRRSKNTRAATEIRLNVPLHHNFQSICNTMQHKKGQDKPRQMNQSYGEPQPTRLSIAAAAALAKKSGTKKKHRVFTSRLDYIPTRVFRFALRTQRHHTHNRFLSRSSQSTVCLSVGSIPAPNRPRGSRVTRLIRPENLPTKKHRRPSLVGVLF